MMFLLLSLMACGDVSNDIFDDDADFLAALPAAERQTVGFSEDTTEAEARGVGERAELVDLSVSIGSGVNAFVFNVLGLVDHVRTLPPTERTQDSRRWGPYTDGCDVDATLLIARNLGVYDWSVSGHPPEGDDAVVLYGTHFSGTSVSAGDGSFVWDQGRYSGWCGTAETGLVTVDYDNRDGVDLLVNVTGWGDGTTEPTDWRYAYSRTESAGDFQYRTREDLADDGSDELADVAVRDRWVPGTGGRSDAVVTGGGFGGAEWRWSQCWDARGVLRWETDNLGVFGESGDASLCAFADAVEVDRL